MTVKVTTRARASQTAKPAPKKTAVKSTAPARKTASKSPATKTAARATASRARKAETAPVVMDTPAPAKRGPGRPKKQVPSTPVSVPTLQERRASANPRKKVSGLTYKELSELTGYGLGSEQFIAAAEIVEGGRTKIEVNHRIAALLPPTSRNGTPKAISNLVGGVIRNLENRGFTISGSWKMDPPKA